MWKFLGFNKTWRNNEAALFIDKNTLSVIKYMIRKILMTKLVEVTLSLYFLLMPFIVVTLF